MKKFSIDIAERNGSAFRRLLRSAERLSERAMAFVSLLVKTPCSRSSASLRSITSADQYFRAMPELYPFTMGRLGVMGSHAAKIPKDTPMASR